MKELSKFDVLVYIADLEERGELVETIRKNIHFQKVSKRIVSERLRELKDMNLITEDLEINENNKKVFDYLAFLYWCKLRGKNYNKLLKRKTKEIFKIIFEGYKTSLQEISKKARLTRQTVSKYLDVLSRNGFIQRVKEKPLIVKSNLNDLSSFYANIFDFSYKEFEKRVDFPKIKHIQSKKIREKIIELHVYSTTVTEGNTASMKDVEKVFGNFSVNLTPKEILEIVNTKEALERLYEIKDEKISINKIKELHKILMANLVENPGEFEYGRKKIIGSDFKLPTGKKRINYGMKSLLNFYRKNIKKIKPQLMGCLLHFIFVSIHPFMDGNGRIGRFLHSWILLKNNLPLFVFNPNKKNKYFDLIEEGRNKNIENFISFCVNEHKKILEGLAKL